MLSIFIKLNIMTSDAEIENENFATIQLEKIKHKNEVEGKLIFMSLII